MATRAQDRIRAATGLAPAMRRNKSIRRLVPRRCMVVSTGMLLAGLVIPLLMVVGLLPGNFLLGFVSFALMGTGAVLTLTLCGEL